jgi:FMN phosphatase YigB (HAD superfamily)
MIISFEHLKKYLNSLFQFILNRAGFLYFRFVFFIFLLKRDRKKVAIFDLDNTLFNTWPLRKKYTDDKTVYTNVEPFPGVLNIISSKRTDGYKILFISARHYLYYPLTFKTIKKHLPSEIAKSLILVPTARDKVFFIERLIKKFEVIDFYDDLSYNHEHGEVKYYQEVIDKIQSLNVAYYGVDFLNKIQN